MMFVLEPPHAYVHPYRGAVIERVLPLNEARSLCGRMGAPADACAWISKSKCYLVIPRSGPVKNRSAYYRHELAHCNGWDHPHGTVDGGSRRDETTEDVR